MTQRISLDIHAHLIPVLPGRLAGLADVTWDASAGKMTVDGHVVGLRAIYQPDALLHWMGAQSVEHAWVSAPPPCYRQHLHGGAALEWSAYLNDGLAEAAAQSEGRLTALPHLPTQDPGIATRIAAEHARNGTRQFSMPTGTGDDRGLSDPGFDALWQTLDDAKATVFFHPGSCADGRLAAFYLGNFLGNPHESAVAISHLLLGGILERYPDITPCFAHGGGTFPMIAGRLQRGFDSNRPGVDTGAPPPKDMLSRIRVDCICHGEEQVALSEQVFGETNVVFGSDWPFPMGLVDPHTQLADTDPARLDRICRKNAEALLAHTKEEN